MKYMRVISCWSCLAMPLMLMIGCAHEPVRTETSFSPLPERVAAPTGRDSATGYADAGVSTDSIAPPPGAAADDWALAETIRAELTRDRKLATAPMEAVVNHGTVTLRGYARTEKARQEICERVSALPGVKELKDEMVIKNTFSSGFGQSRQF